MSRWQMNANFQMLASLYQSNDILLQWIKVWKTSSIWYLQNEQMFDKEVITPKCSKRSLRESLARRSNQTIDLIFIGAEIVDKNFQEYITGTWYINSRLMDWQEYFSKEVCFQINLSTTKSKGYLLSDISQCHTF